ncbi:Fc.00g043670.m01.CDS01 [Cosmosporella sp. VM-42]
MDPLLDLVIHENFGISASCRKTTQKSTKAPDIKNVAGVLALALRLDIPVLAESGNTHLERSNLASGKLSFSHAPILEHDNFVKIIAIGWEDSEDVLDLRMWPTLILEFAEYGTLEESFNLDDTDKCWQNKVSIVTDVATGLFWLHECDVVHSDIKFQNVLIFDRPGSDVALSYRAKICDFGFALDVNTLRTQEQEYALLEGFTAPYAPEAESPILLHLLTKLEPRSIIDHNDEDETSNIPDLEVVLGLALPTAVRRTIISDFLQVLERYDSGAGDSGQSAAAKATYQLYLAHHIGFGCELSTKRALQYLSESASLGFEEAQRSVYAVYAALVGETPSAQQANAKHWLSEGVVEGDRACLQELRIVDAVTYEAVMNSSARRQAMFAWSGFSFDDDFIDSYDVRDISQYISNKKDSGEPIEEDIGAGMTWLHYAVFAGSLDLATRLVDGFNVPIDVQNSEGQTPLWVASLAGNFEISNFLLLEVLMPDQFVEQTANKLQINGADINGQDAQGFTPLHYAVYRSGNIEEEPSVTALLDLRANPLLLDEDGNTPLDLSIYELKPFHLTSLLACPSLTAIPSHEVRNALANAFGIWVSQIKHHRLRCGSVHSRERIAQMVQFLHTDEIVSLYIANRLSDSVRSMMPMLGPRKTLPGKSSNFRTRH